MTFYYRPSLLSPSKSCRRCQEGFHSYCTHHPAADGSSWQEDPETGERRIMLLDRYSRKELPRPPCECERADHIGEPGTCSVFTSGDWHNSRCGRPAKGTLEVKMSYTDQDSFTIEACGIHIAAQRRRMEGARKRDEDWKRRRERDEADRQASRASRDWAVRLQAEFGLKAEPLRAERGDGKIQVGLAPEPLYGILSEVRQMLDEVYGDEHPLARKNNVDPDNPEGSLTS